MVHVSEIDISRVRTMLSDHAVNVISCGSELLSLLVADTSGDQLPHLRTAYVSGGALSRAVVRQWHSAFPGLPIHQGYGSTEAGPIAAGRYSATGIGSDSGPLPLQAAHADCAIELIDDAGVPVRDGCVGQVRVRSRYLADGYLNADPVLEQRFGTDAGGRYFLTGDLGKRNGEGDLVLVSRADRQIKINGRRIELDEVERAMVADEACAQAVVVQTTPPPGVASERFRRSTTLFARRRTTDHCVGQGRLRDGRPDRRDVRRRRIARLGRPPFGNGRKLDRRCLAESVGCRPARPNGSFRRSGR